MEHQREGTSQVAKHVWTPEEDNLLVACMLELREDGKYMVDNGFKSGHLQVLVIMMEKKLPGGGIKGCPHIQSRIKTLKTSWGIVYDMVYGTHTSGFGWDPQRKCVTADKEVWDEYLKSHKKAAPFRSKLFPLFKELCLVFGKDRATGRDAQSATNVLEDIGRGDVGIGIEDFLEPDLGDDPDGGFAHSEVPPSQLGEATSGSRKRKRRGRDETFMEAFKEVGVDLKQGIDEAMNKLCTSFGIEAELNAKREQLFSEVAMLDGLTRQERNAAHIQLCRDDKLMLAFLSLPIDERVNWVQQLIR